MVDISPVGLNRTTLISNQVSLLATYTEKLCKSFCVNSTIRPQVSVTYVSGQPILNGSTVFVPINAVITIVTPGSKCPATTQIFTETFTVAFQGQTALPTSVTILNVGTLADAVKVKCCKTNYYSIMDSLTITIA